MKIMSEKEILKTIELIYDIMFAKAMNSAKMQNDEMLACKQFRQIVF